MWLRLHQPNANAISNTDTNTETNTDRYTDTNIDKDTNTDANTNTNTDGWGRDDESALVRGGCCCSKEARGTTGFLEEVSTTEVCSLHCNAKIIAQIQMPIFKNYAITRIS